MGDELTLKRGVLDGSPIFIGYFTTALAFGLMSRTLSFTLFETALTSLIVYAGSSQFLILSLLKSGSSIAAIVISVFFINARYIFMASSLEPRLEKRKGIFFRLFAGFSTVDEVFSVASSKSGEITLPYLLGLSLISWTGWWSGSIVGAVVGDFLPETIKSAAIITVYAMFSSIFAGEARKSFKAVIVFFIAASLNSILILLVGFSQGTSTVISMLLGALAASFIYTDEEVGLDE